MEKQTSLEWEEKVSEFIEENDKLLVEAGPDTAQRLLAHTKYMLADLINDATATSEELAITMNKLADAIKNPGTPPSAILVLEKKKDVLQAEHNAFVDIQQRMQDFHDVAQSIYDEVPEYDPRYPLPEMKVIPEEMKPSFWQRLFGKR